MDNKRKSISISAGTHRMLLAIQKTMKPQPKIGAMAEWIIAQHLCRISRKRKAKP